MSILDKAAAAVTPMEDEQDRADARDKARSAARPGDWLSLILEHHVEIEDAFREAANAEGSDSARAACKKLEVIIMGHAIAEEAVIYPVLAQTGQSGHADMGYDEQVQVKKDMAQLGELDPASQKFKDKLESIRQAVAHHMYEEEGTWYPGLEEDASEADQQMLTQKYREQFDRYVGDGSSGRPAMTF